MIVSNSLVGLRVESVKTLQDQRTMTAVIECFSGCTQQIVKQTMNHIGCIARDTGRQRGTETDRQTDWQLLTVYTAVMTVVLLGVWKPFGRDMLLYSPSEMSNVSCTVCPALPCVTYRPASSRHRNLLSSLCHMVPDTTKCLVSLFIGPVFGFQCKIYCIKWRHWEAKIRTLALYVQAVFVICWQT